MIYKLVKAPKKSLERNKFEYPIRLRCFQGGRFSPNNITGHHSKVAF